MLLSRFAAAGLLSAVFAAPVFAASATPGYVQAAIDHPARPPWEVQMDAARKPAEVLAFAQVKPGGRISEMVPGSGYYTRMLSKLAGPQGKVYAMVPDGGGGGRYARQAQRDGKPPSAIPADKATACSRGCYPAGMGPYMIPMDHMIAIMNIPEYGNVTTLWANLKDDIERVDPKQAMLKASYPLPEQADAVFSSGGYSALHAKSAQINSVGSGMIDAPLDMKALDIEILKALKPGGVFVIADYASAKGAGFGVVDSLGRVDEDAVKAEILAAGFVLDGESKALANSADDHTKRADDTALGGKPDQFLLRFKKPLSMTANKRPPNSILNGYFGNTEVARMGSGADLPGGRERRVMLHPDGSYQEYGRLGSGPAPFQEGSWFFDANGYHCLLHHYPIDERGVVTCDERQLNVKAGDQWIEGGEKVPRHMLKGHQPLM